MKVAGWFGGRRAEHRGFSHYTPGQSVWGKNTHLKSEKVMTSTVREIEFPVMIGNHRRIIRLVAVFCSRF